jgi:hypothetical protein
MGDMNVLDFVKNVGRNVVTGGMYSLVKAGVDTVKTGNPSALLTQGLDIGMASIGNQLAVDLGGEKAGMAFNAAGGALGAAGAAGAFSSLPGFAAESGVAPLAAGAESATPLAPGVLSSTAPADLAATELTGPVGLPAAAGTTTSGGIISATTAPAMQSAPMATVNNAGVPMNMADSMMAGPAGSSNLAQAAKALGTAPTTQGWWASQPDEVKAILMGGGVSEGGRMLTGALGGLFEGVSVQKRLELEQLINEQRQNQVQYLNKN